MSAEKCGVVLTREMIEDYARKAASEGMRRDPVIVSLRAYKVLDVIRKTYPNWEPEAPSDIWHKAYSMGLLEEE